jgi:hypothetical protein
MASICTSVQVPVQHFQFKTLDGFDFYTQRFTPTLADITVTHPAPSCFPLSSSSQMYTPLYFAKKAEARKNSRYLATARAMSHLFHPYAVETFGSCDAVLDNMLKALADRFGNMTAIVSKSEVSEKSQQSGFGESNIYKMERHEWMY